MQEKKKDALNSLQNKRLDKVKATNSEETAAWANEEKIIDDSNVSIPSEYEVGKAKNWVDNGSQL
ncbi:CDIF630_02480 family spore surface protein [Anaerocolumna xylanovorans]|uniref:DUF3787 domain-containing protein n=1 Tax=Anaerocolumna xylanovorans DSM 12503 TaxID=1121345 RepID=A0A1M7YEZ3_9FIRM|nr:DUF3787 domain-containing protein [Anaerocolumna xylanovorans]SHO51149.1 protein of unknown function [Anaerocolumna xylanovorans DSM 12503]